MKRHAIDGDPLHEFNQAVQRYQDLDYQQLHVPGYLDHYLAQFDTIGIHPLALAAVAFILWGSTDVSYTDVLDLKAAQIASDIPYVLGYAAALSDADDHAALKRTAHLARVPVSEYTAARWDLGRREALGTRHAAAHDTDLAALWLPVDFRATSPTPL